MNAHKLFSDFDSIIRLNDSKISKLKSNRTALRNKIKEHFQSNNWAIPKFDSQGSFPLKTNLNPIKKTTEDGDVKEEYDLDDGVYFICPASERKEPATYHERIKKAAEKHTVESVIDKTTCVRVIYADGHHIDLPSYWLEREGDTPQLTHKSKGYIESDPRAYKDWVDEKISCSYSNGQLRRVIRYLKAWKDYREHKNASLKLPSGFILTILACNHFAQNDRDDLSLKKTTEAIKSSLNLNFVCYRPTVPTNEDLLLGYSKDTVINELGSLLDNADKALDSDNEKEASICWQKVFGDRFPSGEDKNEQAISTAAPLIKTKVGAPWTSC